MVIHLLQVYKILVDWVMRLPWSSNTPLREKNCYTIRTESVYCSLWISSSTLDPFQDPRVDFPKGMGCVIPQHPLESKKKNPVCYSTATVSNQWGGISAINTQQCPGFSAFQGGSSSTPGTLPQKSFLTWHVTSATEDVFRSCSKGPSITQTTEKTSSLGQQLFSRTEHSLHQALAFPSFLSWDSPESKPRYK